MVRVKTVRPDRFWMKNGLAGPILVLKVVRPDFESMNMHSDIVMILYKIEIFLALVGMRDSEYLHQYKNADSDPFNEVLQQEIAVATVVI